MRKYNVERNERWHTAVHEAGHVFMQHLIGGDFSIAEILPVAVEGAIGWSRPDGEVYDTLEEYICQPIVDYAGAEAVNVLIGIEEPRGCYSDYKNADELIKRILDIWTRKKYDQYIIPEIKKNYKSACYSILAANKDILNKIAEVLFTDNAITQLEVSKIFDKYTLKHDANIIKNLMPEYKGDLLYYAGVNIYLKMPVRGFDFDKYSINKAVAITYAARCLVTELLYPGTKCDFGIFEPFDSKLLIFKGLIPYPLVVEHNKWNECVFRKRKDIAYLAIDLADEIGMKLLYPEFKSDTFFEKKRSAFENDICDFYHEIGIPSILECSPMQLKENDTEFICMCILEMLKENKNYLEELVKSIYDEKTDSLKCEPFGPMVMELQEKFPLNRSASELYQRLMTMYINNPVSFAQTQSSLILRRGYTNAEE